MGTPNPFTSLLMNHVNNNNNNKFLLNVQYGA
jgi:hypothetical protein